MSLLFNQMKKNIAWEMDPPPASEPYPSVFCSLYTMGGNVLDLFPGDKRCYEVCSEKFFTGRFCFQGSDLMLNILPCDLRG